MTSGQWFGGLCLAKGAERHGIVVVDICSDYGKQTYARKEVDLTETYSAADILELQFDLPSVVANLEIRLFSKAQATVAVEKVYFERSTRQHGIELP